MPKTKRNTGKTTLHARPLEGLIRVVRDQRVMLDRDLATLYGVETRALIQAVARNASRFPEEFMFQLTKTELENWRSQIVMSNQGLKMGLRRPPYAFTEHGVAMLSTVLHSARAVQMSISIIRAFIRMRELVVSHKELASRVEKLEKRQGQTDSVIDVLIEDINRLGRKSENTKVPSPYSKRRIGYIIEDD